MAETGIEALRTIGDYQFGAGAGAALFPPEEVLELRRTKSGRPEQVLATGERIVTYGTDGRFTLGLEGGRRLASAFSPPQCRVVLGAESVPFVRDGKNAFAKFVRDVDPAIRASDEVLVVFGEPDGHTDLGSNPTDGETNGGGGTDGAGANDGNVTVEPDSLLAVGRAELPAEAMLDFETGMAVKVRHGTGGER